MVEAIVDTNAREVAVRYDAAHKVVASNLWRALQDIGSHLQRILVQEKLSKGGILEPRSGTARRAVFERVETDGQDVIARVGADLSIAKYLRAHEFGATILPKSAAHLTVPLPAVLTASGVMRSGWTAGAIIANPQSVGFWGTFTAKGVIFGRVRESGVPPTPLFVLKDSVTLPARAPFKTTLDESRPWINARLGAGLDEAAREL